MSQELKDLKIKTNTVKLLLGDLKMSDKEIAQQKARIEKVKADAEKDDHDTRAQVHAPPRRRAAAPLCLRTPLNEPARARIAQEAVLAEMVGGRASEVDLLKQRGEELDIYMVRGGQRAPAAARARAHAPTRTRARRPQMSKKDALSATDEWGAGVEKLKAACAMLAENGHPGVVYDAC